MLNDLFEKALISFASIFVIFSITLIVLTFVQESKCKEVCGELVPLICSTDKVVCSTKEQTRRIDD
jgi:hypothetical protein